MALRSISVAVCRAASVSGHTGGMFAPLAQHTCCLVCSHSDGACKALQQLACLACEAGVPNWLRFNCRVLCALECVSLVCCTCHAVSCCAVCAVPLQD